MPPEKHQKSKRQAATEIDPVSLARSTLNPPICALHRCHRPSQLTRIRQLTSPCASLAWPWTIKNFFRSQAKAVRNQNTTSCRPVSHTAVVSPFAHPLLSLSPLSRADSQSRVEAPTVRSNPSLLSAFSPLPAQLSSCPSGLLWPGLSSLDVTRPFRLLHSSFLCTTLP